MTDSDHVFKFEHVTVKNDSTTVLDDFNLTVRPREKVVMTGSSGIGKTTVVRLPLGFRRPDAGRILFRGREVDGHEAWKVRREVAYVSQDVALGHGTVRTFLDRAFSYRVNNDMAPSENHIHKTLDLLHLPESILDKSLADVSGGEKQRIAILVALNLGRKIFVLDEITSALDPDLKQHVMRIFLQNKEWTVLAISHDLPEGVPGVRELPLAGIHKKALHGNL